MTEKKVNRLIVPNVYTANGVEPVTSVNNILPVNGNVTIPIPTVPTNVSAFYNDAGYLTSTTLDGYATQSWVQQQGYLTSVPSQYITDTELSITLADYVTSANLTTILDDYATTQWVNNQGYITSSALTTTLSDYALLTDIPTVGNGTITINQGGTQKGTFTVNQSGNTTIDLDAGGGAVDQTFDGTSQNAQSGVAISNAKFIRNTATGTDALTILGTATRWSRATNIGYDSTARYYATALGANTEASGNRATALGFHAIASEHSAIQIGYGTNSTENTLSIGFYENNTNWQLLDGTTGLIPDARISTNIARTSQIPTMTSQLTNNSGFITSADLPTNYVTTDTAQSISGQKTFTNTIKSSVDNSLALTLSTGEAFGVTVKRTDANNEIKFGIGQGGDNRGIWDVRHNKWAFSVTNDGKSYTLGKEIAVKSDLNNLANKDLSNLSSTGNSKFQTPLVSGTNIKTVNNTSILGSGNINVANTNLSNLSTTGQAIIDGKADTTLSNVSSIDSSSAVTTALNTKVDNDDYYYKSGDTDSYQWFGGGYITASATEIWFTLPTPKSMANVTTVTCTALTTAFRKSNGGYMPSSGGNGWNAKANATVTISKQTENALSVNVKYNKWGGTNNTPVGVLASISLSFT